MTWPAHACRCSHILARSGERSVRLKAAPVGRDALRPDPRAGEAGAIVGLEVRKTVADKWLGLGHARARRHQFVTGAARERVNKVMAR
eukprot:scaffold290866_cov21-Tisochrysis_lutea.AAC.2